MATTTAAQPPAGEPRMIALERIRIREGFNPRTERESKKLDRLAASIAAKGVLTPISVTPNDAGGYDLIAGERRLRAARKAGLTEIPALVRPVDADTGGFDDATIENLVRENLTPVDEARACERLLAMGLTRKGVAERLQVTQSWVKDRLQILNLDAEIQDGIGDGDVPLSAVPALASLAKIHADLPGIVARRVGQQASDEWEEPLTWRDVAGDPIAAVIPYDAEDVQLPADVYLIPAPYPIDRFSLADGIRKQLEELCSLIGCEPESFQVRFDGKTLQAAEQLGAGHQTRDRWGPGIIVGQDVADQLAADYVKACLEVQRSNAGRDGGTPPPARGETATEEGAAAPAAEEKERRRAEREAEQKARQAAQTYNADLGAAVLRELGKAKLDERTIKILAAIDFGQDLERIAARGARYCLPGWEVEDTTPSGKAKSRLAEPWEAAAKAAEFLEGAKTAGQLAGRLLALVVMARYAKQEAVANSHRTFYDLRAGGGVPYGRTALPWSKEVLELVERLAEERLPQHLTEDMRRAREERERDERERAKAEEVAAKVDHELRKRLPEMTAEQRLEALREFTATHGRHTVVAQHLREHIGRLNAQAAVGSQAESRAKAA